MAAYKNQFLRCDEWQLIAEGNARRVYRYTGSLECFQRKVLKLWKAPGRWPRSTTEFWSRKAHSQSSISQQEGSDASTDDEKLPLHSFKGFSSLTKRGSQSFVDHAALICFPSKNKRFSNHCSSPILSHITLLHSIHLPSQFFLSIPYSAGEIPILLTARSHKKAASDPGIYDRRSKKKNDDWMSTKTRLPKLCYLHDRADDLSLIQMSNSVTPCPSSLVFFEEDLVTPPFGRDRLLQSLSELEEDEVPNVSHLPVYSQFTTELKLKSGLKAFLHEHPEDDMDAYQKYFLATSGGPFVSSDVRSIQNDLSAKVGGKGSYNFNTIKCKKGAECRFRVSRELRPSQEAAIAKHLANKSVSRFTLLQILKEAQGVIQKQSFFSPEMFFSQMNDLSVIFTQLDALVESPQNNYRVFMDGTCLIWRYSVSNLRSARPSLHQCKFIDSVLMMQNNPTTMDHFSMPPLVNDALACAMSDSVGHAFANQDDPVKRIIDLLNSNFPARENKCHVDAIPTELRVDSRTPPVSQTLKSLSKITGHMIHSNRSLFHRLQCLHALAEGQQDIAICFVRILEEKYFNAHYLGNQGGIGLVHPLRLGAGSTEYIPDLPVQCGETSLLYGSDSHVPRLDTDFVLAHFADRVYGSKDIVKSAFLKFHEQMERETASNTNIDEPDGGGDSETLLAERIQHWHRQYGLSLLDKYFSSSRKNRARVLQGLLRGMLDWIYRYLVGRTFLDCSVMINTIVTFDDHLTPVDREFLKSNRYELLQSMPLSRLLDDDLKLSNNKATSDLIAKDEPSQNTHHCLIEHFRNLSLPLIFEAAAEGAQSQSKIDKDGHRPAQVKWIELTTLIKKAQMVASKQSSYRREQFVSVWYRFNVIDLDMKSPSKVHEWYKQRRDLLSYYHHQCECSLSP